MILRAVPKTVSRKPRIIRQADTRNLDMSELEDFGEPTAGATHAPVDPDPMETTGDDAAEPSEIGAGGEVLLQQLDSLRREVLQEAQQQAEQLIATARTRAIKMLEDAKQECDQLREQTRQEAYQQGAEQGLTDALADANERFDGMEQMLDRLGQQLMGASQQALEQTEKRCLAFSLALAEKIVGREVSASADAVMPSVHQGIQVLYDAQRVTVWVSADDAAFLREHRQSLLERFDHLEQINLQVDETLQHGECLLDSEQGLVDATFEERWRLARQFLTQLESEADSTSPSKEVSQDA